MQKKILGVLVIWQKWKTDGKGNKKEEEQEREKRREGEGERIGQETKARRRYFISRNTIKVS